MNGAQALHPHARRRAASTSCFTNPGTSEMHFVAALDAVPEMRGVLALFEGVATGAADGYGAWPTGRPATLLHLGPGLGNGLANLHNARTGHTPSSTSSATTPPTTSSTTRRSSPTSRRVARNVSGWIRWSAKHRRRSAPTRPTPSPPRSARPGRSPRSSCPADVSWRDGGEAGRRRRPPPRRTRRPTTPSTARRRGAALGRAGGAARRRRACCASRASAAAAAIAAATGAKLLCETFPARHRARRRACRRSSASAYLAEFAPMQLDGAAPPRARRRQGAGVVLRLPRQGRADLVPDGCEVHVLADRRRRRRRRARGARRRARRAGRRAPASQPPARPELPDRRAHRRGGRATRSARCCPRARSSSDEAQHRRACSSPGATAGAPPPRLALASPAARSARACPWPPAPRSPAPTAR